MLLIMSPMAAAHHGDTPEKAEFAAPLPIELYHHYIMVGRELADLKAAYPNLMNYKVIGKSVLGLDIYGVEITNFKSDSPPMESRYRLYFDGSIHSNEQLGMELSFDIMNFLLAEYSTNQTAKFIVDNRRTFVVPLVNPDGNVRDSRRNINSVDLNRNFPAGWGGPGSTARGPSPLSEPETQAVAGFLKEVKPHYANSFHTGTLMLLHPYGNYPRGSNVTSPDHAMYTSICQTLQAKMNEAAGGREVPCGQVYSTIYPASGSTVDYMYDEFGTVSWTYEVDDEQDLMWSLEGIRARLGEAWVAVEHAFLNVERYGALLELADIELLDGPGAKTLTTLAITIKNEGMGASNNSRLKLELADGRTFDYPVPETPAGNSTRFVLTDLALAPGATAKLDISYNKTLFKGFSDHLSAALSVVMEGEHLGVRVETPGQELGRTLGAPGSSAPAIDATLLVAAVAAALVVFRRRAT
jgi:hypothetical protein